MTEKTDFLISPEYSVPATTTVRSEKLTSTALGVQALDGRIALVAGAARMVKSGSP